MLVTIYALYDPRQPSVVRYVGKTANALTLRRNKHISEARAGNACHRGNWIRSLLLAGVSPQIAPLEICDENVWQQRERFWIAGHRQSGALTNNTDGGDGMSKGYVASAAARQKLSAALKGHVTSEATRQKISAAHKGRAISDATLQKMSAAHKGHVAHEATRLKISASMKGKVRSEATRLKMSAAQKAFFTSRKLGVA